MGMRPDVGRRPRTYVHPVLPPQRIGDGNGHLHQPRDGPPAGRGSRPGGDPAAPDQRPRARSADAPRAREPPVAPRRRAVLAMTTTSETAVAGLARAAVAGDQRAWDALVRRLDPLVRGVVRAYRLNAA